MKLGEIFEKPGKPLMTLMTSQYNEEEIIPAPFVYRELHYTDFSVCFGLGQRNCRPEILSQVADLQFLWLTQTKTKPKPKQTEKLDH